MTANAESTYWFWSLLSGQFSSPPGVRLYETVTPLRAASESELVSINKRVRSVRWLKGGRLIWGDFTHVRDILSTTFRPVVYPVTMSHLWRSK